MYEHPCLSGCLSLIFNLLNQNCQHDHQHKQKRNWSNLSYVFKIDASYFSMNSSEKLPPCESFFFLPEEKVTETSTSMAAAAAALFAAMVMVMATVVTPIITTIIASITTMVTPVITTIITPIITTVVTSIMASTVMVVTHIYTS